MLAKPAKENYFKIEKMIPMRDGIKLFTAIYIPRDTSGSYPFLMVRTPYSCAPYGEANYPTRISSNPLLEQEKYIFVFQDVRGRYMSEGYFTEVTPSLGLSGKSHGVDESSDTHDTIDWLLQNLRHHNGRVGIYGISYPGFYASASLVDAHPAIKAVSPQAPVTDEFEGDDVYHRGAYFLMDNFSFLNSFDYPRPRPWKTYPPLSKHLKIKDAYDFYLQAGPLKNFNRFYFHDSSKIWNEYLLHYSKDAYWTARNIRDHLRNIRPAVLIVGGWFDAEDLFGTLKTFEALQKQSPKNVNYLIMGPWTHGAWVRSTWKSFSNYSFGINTNSFFQKNENDFFKYYLKDKGNLSLAHANVFITGSNQWQTFSQWPPENTTVSKWYLGTHQKLWINSQQPVQNGYDQYTSDPLHPVPYTKRKSSERVNEYMAEDQSFASLRADVLHYTSEPLQDDITLTGNIFAHLYVSTSGTDADFIVKLIDVLPENSKTEQLVRAEVIRGKFREGFTNPKAFTSGSVTSVNVELNDVAHTFLKNHRIMIQVQSSWFPLVDINPQQFMEIPKADSKDFKKATIRLYHDSAHSSYMEVKTLNKK
ncbi:MAG: CocE/NonD family hydrolase [Flavisolibacter sp.]